MTICRQGRAAVEMDSGLAEEAHVLEDAKGVWSAALSLVDLDAGLNSFYKLQLLQLDHGRVCFASSFLHLLPLTICQFAAADHLSVSGVGAHWHVAWRS